MSELIGNLSRNIKIIREFRGLSQAELAGKARMSPATLSRIESGVLTNTTLETVEALALALDVDPIALLDSSTSYRESHHPLRECYSRIGFALFGTPDLKVAEKKD